MSTGNAGPTLTPVSGRVSCVWRREVLLLLIEDRWTDGLGRARPALRASAMSTLIAAARLGMGVVMAPESLAGAYPELVPLPSLPVRRERALWLAMPEELTGVPRVRIVADLLFEKLGAVGSSETGSADPM